MSWLVRMSALVIATASALVFVPDAQCAEPWTLGEIVARVRAEHPLLQASRLRVSSAEGLHVSAGKWPNPRLVFSGENLRPGADDFDPWTQADWFLYVIQPFETGGKRGHRQKAAELGVDLAELSHEMLEREVVHEVKVAYQNVLTAQAKLALTRDSWSRLEQLAELNHVRSVEGYVAEGDYIKSSLEAERFESALRRAELLLERARIAFLQSLGKTEFSVDFTLESPELPSAPLDVDVVREAASLRPEIRAAEAAVARARALYELEQAQVDPDLAASIGYKRNGPVNTLYAGVSLPLPIFDRNQGGILAGRADLAAAEADLVLQRSRVQGELEAALEAVRITRDQVESLRADFIERADQSRAVALAAYREGAADLLIVLEAERTRNGAQELVVEAVHEYRLALFELERAAGVSQLSLDAEIVGAEP